MRVEQAHWSGKQHPVQLEVIHSPEGPQLSWHSGERTDTIQAWGSPPWTDPVDRAVEALRAVHPQLSPSLLGAAELALRNPPVDLDDLSLEQLRNRVSEKWNTYQGEDLIACWVAEMDFPIAAPIRASLTRALSTDDLGYAIGLRETGLADTFAERMTRRFDWQIDADRCEILSEVVQGLYIALDAYSEPGDGAIVQTPIYPPFLQSVEECGRRLVENRLVDGTRGFEIDFDALARSCDDRTRLLMLCHPHNPTGRVFTRGELERLAEFVLENDLVVVSDEIHSDLVFDHRDFIPFGSLSPEVGKRTVTLNSASKAFNIPGLRTAVAHFGSADLQNRFNGCIPRHARGGIGLLGIQATLAAWRHSAPWLDRVRQHLQDNRDRACSFLERRCPGIRAPRPEATYLLWLDCTDLDLPQRPAHYFLEHAKVVLSDGLAFGPGLERCARLNLATSGPILQEILDRIANAVDRR